MHVEQTKSWLTMMNSKVKVLLISCVFAILIVACVLVAGCTDDVATEDDKNILVGKWVATFDTKDKMSVTELSDGKYEFPETTYTLDFKSSGNGDFTYFIRSVIYDSKTGSREKDDRIATSEATNSDWFSWHQLDAGKYELWYGDKDHPDEKLGVFTVNSDGNTAKITNTASDSPFKNLVFTSEKTRNPLSSYYT